MATFIDTSATKEIHAEWWPEGEDAMIKRLGYLDKRRIRQRCIVMDAAPDAEGNVHGTLDEAEWYLASMEYGIASWTLKDGDEDVPCTPENMARLEEVDMEFIVEEIHAFSPSRSAEQQRNFRD